MTDGGLQSTPIVIDGILYLSTSWNRVFAIDAETGGEIWHFSQPFLNSNAIGNLWAVAYTVSNNLVVDVGFNRGLTKTSTDWETFLGFTYLLPYRIWKEQ